jgi:hypothetical protein
MTLDIRDGTAVSRCLGEIRPDMIVHATAV